MITVFQAILILFCLSSIVTVIRVKNEYKILENKYNKLIEDLINK